ERGLRHRLPGRGQRPHPEILPPHRPGPEGAGAGEGPAGKLRPRGQLRPLLPAGMSPVPEKFQAYGEAVCAFLSHATRREKAAVRQELMDHLTDHTQALLDAGCPPEAAETRALAAMGEAQE